MICYFTKADSKINFIMVGDWGGQLEAPCYTPVQEKVASQMRWKAIEINSKFTIALAQGDKTM